MIWVLAEIAEMRVIPITLKRWILVIEQRVQTRKPTEFPMVAEMHFGGRRFLA
jgi:hypothetical protein